MYPNSKDKIPAAMYIRMFTEHQKYSPENQAAAIREYAERNGYEIIKTYTDGGKSGLNIAGRAALQQMLKDVQSHQAEYKAILVLDVTRRRQKSIVMDFSHFSKLEEEINRLHGEYEEIKENCGLNVLNFTLVKGYVKTLVMNPRVNRYLRINNPDILEHLESIVDIDNLNPEE